MKRDSSMNNIYKSPFKLQTKVNLLQLSKSPSSFNMTMSKSTKSVTTKIIQFKSKLISTENEVETKYNFNKNIFNSPTSNNSKKKFNSIFLHSNRTQTPKFKIKQYPLIINFQEEDKFVIDKNTIKENKMKSENEIKKLNYWDTQNILVKDIDEKDFLNPLIKLKEVESMNWMNELRSDLSKLKLDKTNPGIRNFYKKMDMDQKSIFIHNINIAKRQFNFEVFHKNNQVEEFITSKEDYSINKNNLEIDFDKYMMTTEEIKNDENYELLSSINFYRDVIRQKKKTENGFRKEIMIMSQKFYGIKIEKKKLEKTRADLINLINKLRIEVHIHKNQVEKQVETFSKDNLVLQQIPIAKIIPDQTSNNSVFNFQMIKRPLQRKSTKTLTIKDIEMINAKTEQISNVYKMQQELERINNFFENKKKIANKKVENLSQEIEKMNKETKIIKNNMNNLIQDQRNYYYEILRKGIDVRNEGLTWILKRLIELNGPLDFTKFPRYLDHHQIEFLMSLSSQTIENNQLKIIMKTLKNRQKIMRDEKSNFILGSNLTNSADQIENDNDKINENSKYKEVFSARLVKVFHDIFNKYEHIANPSHEMKMEEIHVNKLINELKLQIGKNKHDLPFLNDYEDDNVNFSSQYSNGFFNYFKENNKNKELFDEIMFLREVIKRNDDEIEKSKREEIKNFKKKFENQKLSKNSGIQYEMTYSALFGNGISV